MVSFCLTTLKMTSVTLPFIQAWDWHRYRVQTVAEFSLRLRISRNLDPCACKSANGSMLLYITRNIQGLPDTIGVSAEVYFRAFRGRCRSTTLLFWLLVQGGTVSEQCD